VIREVFRRIDAAGDPGIFLHLAPLAELEAAAEALGTPDPERPLWGMPFAVKDNIDVAGGPTTAACPAYAYEPEQDSAAVARLRAAGAIPVGKTSLDQFATGLVGVGTPWPVPRNAVDRSLVPAVRPPAPPSPWRAASCPSRSAPTPQVPAASLPH
jgi:allophanate hydrolase